MKYGTIRVPFATMLLLTSMFFSACELVSPFRATLKDHGGRPIQGATVYPTPLVPKSSNARTSDKNGRVTSKVGAFVVHADGYNPMLIDLWDEGAAEVTLPPASGTSLGGNNSATQRLLQDLMFRAAEINSKVR